MCPDVVIIGGGIIGCACAYYLSLEGVRVHVVEKGALASGASKAGEGGIPAPERPGIRAKMAEAAGSMYRALAAELPLDIEYQQEGTLFIAETEEDLCVAKEDCRLIRAHGYRCELLDSQEVIDLEPNLAQDVAGGVFYADGGRINPHLVVLGLVEAARRRGAAIQTFTEVKGIELSNDGGSVQAVATTAGRIPVAAVVNAAGAWSGSIGRMVGLEVPIVPRKGYVLVTEPVSRLIHCTTVSEMGYTRAALSGDEELLVALEVEQPRSGNLLIGMSREFVGFDCAVSPQVISAMVARHLRFFPSNTGVHLIRAYAGLRPYSPDNLPIISEAGTIEGFYVATGHEGEGQGMAPITGKLVAQMITGQKPDLPLGDLSLSRFTK